MRWLVCLGLLAGMALSSHLWTSDRAFPAVPAFSGLPDLPALPCGVLVGLFAASLAITAARPSLRFAPWAAIAFGLLLTLFDVDRMQPWFFQSLLLLATLGSRPATSVVIIATYFWSGIHKLNGSFAEQVFPLLLEPFGLTALQPFWLVAPLAGIATAILLTIPRTRVAGLVLAVALHGFVLWSLGPFGHDVNSVIWPWNFEMPLLVAVVFGSDRQALIPGVWHGWAGRGALLVAGLLPILNLVGRWDDNLSFSLYSGTTKQAFFFFPTEPKWLPEAYRPFVESQHGHWVIDVTRWALATTNAPPYPETRTYRALFRRLRRDGPIRLIVSRPGETPQVVESTY